MNDGRNIEKWVKNYQVPFVKRKEDAWEELKSKLPASNQKVVHLFYRNKWIYLAASVLVAAVLLTFIFDSVYGTRRYLTEAGQQQTILLPDSTKVKLNPLSVLTVNYSYISGIRKLGLEGQALFEVTPGKLFTVIFAKGKVSVLGTRFLVSAYENMPSQVDCLSGKVKVTSEQTETMLMPGKGVVIENDKKPEMIDIQSQKILDITVGKYDWYNVPLQTIFNTIENYTGYTISASDEIKSRKFSGHIDLNDLKESCRILSFAMDLNFIRNEQNKTIVFESTK